MAKEMRKYNGHATAGELEGAHQKRVDITQKMKSSQPKIESAAP